MDFVQVVPLGTLGVHSNHDIVAFYESGVLRIVGVNEVRIPEVLEKSSRRLYTQDAPVTDAPPDQFSIVRILSKDGAEDRFYDKNASKPYSSIADSDFYSIVHVHTFDGFIVAIDDIHPRSLSPVQVLDDPRRQTQVADSIKRLDDFFIIIAMKPGLQFGKFDTVSHVMIPTYNSVLSLDERSRMGTPHVAVTFRQQDPLVLLPDNTLISWYEFFCRRSIQRSKDVSLAPSIIKVANEAEVPRHDWTIPVQNTYYYIDDKDTVHVWDWRRRLIGDRRSESIMPQMVYDPRAQRLHIGGFKRVYPLPDGGKTQHLWFYRDVRHANSGITDETLVLHNRYIGTGIRNANLIGLNTDQRVTELLDLKQIEVVF